MLSLAACAAHDPSPLKNTGSQSLLNIADEARRAGNLEAAAPMYQRAVAADPTSVPAQMGLADTSYQLGHLEEAEAAYRSVLQLKPASAEAGYGLGRVQLARGDKQAAIATVDRVIAAGGASADLFDLKGVALDLLGRHPDAQAAYRAGLAQNAADRRLRNNYALSLAATRDFPPSLEILRDLANGPEATPKNRQNLALVLGLSGDGAGSRAVAGKDLAPGQLDANQRFFDAARGAPTPSL